MRSKVPSIDVFNAWWAKMGLPSSWIFSIDTNDSSEYEPGDKYCGSKSREPCKKSDYYRIVNRTFDIATKKLLRKCSLIKLVIQINVCWYFKISCSLSRYSVALIRLGALSVILHNKSDIQTQRVRKAVHRIRNFSSGLYSSPTQGWVFHYSGS